MSTDIWTDGHELHNELNSKELPLVCKLFYRYDVFIINVYDL